MPQRNLLRTNADDLDTQIPQSVAEIFEISNKNRMRNKMKKKNVSENKKSSSKTEKGAMLNFQDVTEIIKMHHKQDAKENHMEDFKAVCNYNDKEFASFLGWNEQEASISPKKVYSP